MVEAHSKRLVEFLQRVMQYAAPLTTPANVAWFLSSYARDALARIEGRQLRALQLVHEALEAALGIRFEGAQGIQVGTAIGLLLRREGHTGTDTVHYRELWGDDVLVDIDRERLEERMRKYFDPTISHAEMARIAPGIGQSNRHFGAI